MSLTHRLSSLARAAALAAVLLAPAALGGCTRSINDSTYYLGQNEHVPLALCAAWAAC